MDQPGVQVDLLRSRHLAGIRVFRGQEFGDGDRPAITDRGTWTEVADRRTYRAQARRPFRFYLLTHLDLTGAPTAAPALPPADVEAIALDERGNRAHTRARW